jgi:hypothetical protein
MIQLVIDDFGTIRLTQQVLEGLPGKIKTVVRRASVDAIRAVRGQIPKSINKRFDITKSEVRRQMKLTTKTEDGGMRTGLIVTGDRIPVMKFEVTPKSPPSQRGMPMAQRPVVKIITVRGHATVGKPNRFVAEMSSGHIGVFMRKSKKGLPIKESLTESVPEMIRTKPIRKEIEARAEEVFTKAIERNIKAVLEHQKP